MSQKVRAVVIDDLDYCRDLLACFLVEQGYQVESYASAKSSSVCSRKGGRCPSEHACADLLLTDNKMPLLTGIEFVEDQAANGCKLVAGKKAILSGSWTDEELEKARALGCKTFEKPYNLQALNDWLNATEVRT